MTVDAPERRPTETSPPGRPGPPGGWPLGATIVVLSVVAVLLTVPHWPGRLVVDDQFAFFARPAATLGDFLHAWSWSRDLGGSPSGYAPVTYTFAAALHALHLEPWLVQRLYHATLLAFGATGTAVLARRMDPRSTRLPLLAGLWFLAAPFTMAFLLPSWLFQNACLTPWLMLSAWAGTVGPSRWRHPALFALCVAIAGGLNPPGLAWAALPVVPLLLVRLQQGDTTLRRVVGWTWRAGLLSLAVLLPALLKSVLGARTLGRNLQTTESVAAVSQSSSWSESLRGLGSWLLYWNPGGRLLLPHLATYFSSWIVVLLTFVPVVVAFAVVALTRWRPRLALGAVMLTSAAAMVGAFPFDQASPAGSLLLRLYAEVPQTVALRNTYKAGSGLLVATAILGAQGVLVAAGHARAEVRRHRGAAATAWRAGTVAAALALVALVLVSAWPLVGGGLYQEVKGSDAVPAYWSDATSWLDAQPGDGRVAIYPGTVSPAYRWGTLAGDDLFAAMLHRPYVLPSLLSDSSADAADLLDALDAEVSTGVYQAGSFAPVARRLGIEYVLIRNDVDWRATGTPRPATLGPFRADPDLEPVATFGDEGENVLAPDDSGTLADLERSLPPVEVYRVRGVTGSARVVAAGPSLVVSGNGAAWPGLAHDGLLDTGLPLEYTGRLDPVQIAERTTAGSPLVVTDTNRKRNVGLSSASGPTLTADADDPPGDLFARPGTQSVSTFSDAAAVFPIDAGNLVDPGVANRAAAATDQDPGTAWRTGAFLPLRRQGLEIDLAQPRTIDAVTVTPAQVRPGDRRVIGVEVVLPDGTTVPVTLSDGPGTARFPRQLVGRIQVRVTTVEGDGPGPFGLAEVSVPGLDLRELVQVPDDLLQAAVAAPDLARRLETASLTYRFERLRSLPTDEETALLRRFWTLGTHPSRLTGTLQATNATTDLILQTLLPGDVRALSTGRWQDRIAAAGALAADGDPSTAWRTVPAEGQTLVLGYPTQRVDAVDVVLDGSTLAAPVTLSITSGDGETQTVTVAPPAEPCDGPCEVRASLPVDDPTSPGLSVRVSGASDAPVSVLEVETDGASNAALPPTVVDECRDDLVQLDGVPVPVRVQGSTSDLLAGRPVAFESCEDTTLTPGWHRLTSGWELPLDTTTVSRADVDTTLPTVVTRAAPIAELSPSRLVIDADAEPGDRVVTGSSVDERWHSDEDATMVELDAQAAWVPAAATSHVALSFGPEGPYRLAVGLSTVAVLAVIALLVLDPRRGWPPPAGRRRHSPLVPELAAVVFGLLVSGFVGALIAGLAVLAVRRRWAPAAAVGAGAVALVACAALATVPPFGASLTPVGPLWPLDRDLSHSLARMAAVVLGATIAAALADLARQTRREALPAGSEALDAVLPPSEPPG